MSCKEAEVIVQRVLDLMTLCDRYLHLITRHKGRSGGGDIWRIDEEGEED